MSITINKIISIIILIFLPVISTAKPMTIKSMQELESIVYNKSAKINPNDILVVFDIDMTLTQPKDHRVHFPIIEKYAKEYKKIIGSMPQNKKEYPAMLAVALPQQLIDNATPYILANIRSKGVKSIALTASFTGKFNEIENFEVLRYQTLINFGIDFENTLPELTYLKLMNLLKYRGNYPVFYKGILFTNGEKSYNSKGNVLVEFLRQIKFTPKVIVMVDDKQKHLSNVEDCLLEYQSDIDFVGLEYKGALSYKDDSITLEMFKEFWQNLANQAVEVN